MLVLKNSFSQFCQPAPIQRSKSRYSRLRSCQILRQNEVKEATQLAQFGLKCSDDVLQTFLLALKVGKN